MACGRLGQSMLLLQALLVRTGSATMPQHPVANVHEVEGPCTVAESLLMVSKSVKKTQLGKHNSESLDSSTSKDVTAGGEPPAAQRAKALVEPDLASEAISRKVGGASQSEVGLRNFHYIMSYVAPPPTARMLEVGVGFGRNARYFATYLDGSRGGEFHGFDIDAELIRWGQEHLTPKYPHVKFQWSNVSSDHYGGGSETAEKYTFPYASDYFDVVVAPSLWTHLRTAAALRYLSETFRVLKPGGEAYLNFFLVDGASEKVINEDRVDDEKFNDKLHIVNYEKGVRWGRVNDDEGMEAFSEEWLKAQVQSMGFRILTVHKGTWAGSERVTGLSAFQDHIFLMKPTGVPEEGK